MGNASLLELRGIERLLPVVKAFGDVEGFGLFSRSKGTSMLGGETGGYRGWFRGVVGHRNGALRSIRHEYR